MAQRVNRMWVPLDAAMSLLPHEAMSICSPLAVFLQGSPSACAPKAPGPMSVKAEDRARQG